MVSVVATKVLLDFALNLMVGQFLDLLCSRYAKGSASKVSMQSSYKIWYENNSKWMSPHFQLQPRQVLWFLES